MRFSAVFVAMAAPLLVAASALPRTDPMPASQCNVNNLQCCNSVQDANSGPVSSLAGLLGIVLGPLTGQVGLTCNPLSVIGIGGNSCAAQPVCCTGNNFNGLIVVGCSPVNVNL